MDMDTIRWIQPEDREVFLRLTEEFYASDAVLHPVPPEYHRRTFEELLRSDVYLKACLFVPEGHPVGYGLLSRSYSPEAGGPVVWVEELYIRPQARGMGLGSAFFSWLERSLPAARYRLEVEPDNLGALRLYRRKGYAPLPYLQMVRDLP